MQQKRHRSRLDSSTRPFHTKGVVERALSPPLDSPSSSPGDDLASDDESPLRRRRTANSPTSRKRSLILESPTSDVACDSPITNGPSQTLSIRRAYLLEPTPPRFRISPSTFSLFDSRSNLFARSKSSPRDTRHLLRPDVVLFPH